MSGVLGQGQDGLSSVHSAARRDAIPVSTVPVYKRRAAKNRANGRLTLSQSTDFACLHILRSHSVNYTQPLSSTLLHPYTHLGASVIAAACYSLLHADIVVISFPG